MVDRPEVLRVANGVYAALDAIEQKVFLCFGTLLFFVRDRVFSIDTDIDIGIIGPPEQPMNVFANAFTISHVVRDDHTREPLQATFRTREGINVDLFFWKRLKGMYYHCYDDRHVFGGRETLDQYTFKGIPADCFDVPKPHVDKLMSDIRFRGITRHGTVLKELPQDPTSGYCFPVPLHYGACLDYWYPDWTQKRPQFGVSEAAHTFTAKSCKGIGWEK